MREPLRDKERILHIQEACHVLLEQSKSDTKDEIKNNPIKFYGYVKLVEIIGEASFKLTNEFKAIHTEIPWNMMKGMRHVLVHEYYRISVDKLWDTLCYDIPELKIMIDKLVSEI